MVNDKTGYVISFTQHSGFYPVYNKPDKRNILRKFESYKKFTLANDDFKSRRKKYYRQYLHKEYKSVI